MQSTTLNPTGTWRSTLLKFLQLLILSVSLALVYYMATFFSCRIEYYRRDASVPPLIVIASLAIPLLWILPIYFVIALASPILLYRLPQSTYGRRPTWLSAKGRYFATFLPALVTFGFAVYLISSPSWAKTAQYHDEYEYMPGDCKQGRIRFHLPLILSLLMFIESYITYRLDSTQLDPHQPPTCGKRFCFHKCVSTVNNNNLSTTSPLSSTYCASVRLIRNTRIIALVFGTYYTAFMIATFFLNTGNDFWIVLSHILSLLLWLLIIISIFRPTITRPVQDLQPILRLVLSLISSLAVLVYNGFLLQFDWDVIIFACRLFGALFSFLVTFEVVWTFSFDRRRFNTARKVDIWMKQQQKYEQPSQQLNSGSTEVAIELVNRDGEFQGAAPFDSKIQI